VEVLRWSVGLRTMCSTNQGLSMALSWHPYLPVRVPTTGLRYRRSNQMSLKIRSELCVAPGWRVSGEELPRIVGTAPERGSKFQEAIGGGQVGEANGVHTLAHHVGEALENRRQLQEGRFFTHLEPMPDDKGSED